MEIKFEVRFNSKEKKIYLNLNEYTVLHGEAILCSLLAHFAESIVERICEIRESKKIEVTDGDLFDFEQDITCRFSSNTSESFISTNLYNIDFLTEQHKLNFFSDLLAFIYGCCQTLESKVNKSA